MYLSKDKKREIFSNFGGDAGNTGSTEGQIALFTFRINHLTQHLKKNHKDSTYYRVFYLSGISTIQSYHVL